MANKVTGVAAGYPTLSYQLQSDPDPRFWGPQTSSDVKETDVKLEGGIDDTSFGLPLDVSGIVKYTTKSDLGAVLMCDTEVVAEGLRGK